MLVTSGQRPCDVEQPDRRIAALALVTAPATHGDGAERLVRRARLDTLGASSAQLDPRRVVRTAEIESLGEGGAAAALISASFCSVICMLRNASFGTVFPLRAPRYGRSTTCD